MIDLNPPIMTHEQERLNAAVNRLRRSLKEMSPEQRVLLGFLYDELSPEGVLKAESLLRSSTEKREWILFHEKYMEGYGLKSAAAHEEHYLAHKNKARRELADKIMRLAPQEG